MGEYIPTRVKFGGKLKADKVDQMIELLNAQCLRTDDDEDDPTPLNLDETFSNSEINYGQIDSITTFCKAEGLNYEHWIDACAGCDPTIERYIDGESENLSYSDGEVMIPLSKVIEIEELTTGLANILALAKRWATPLKLEIVP